MIKLKNVSNTLYLIPDIGPLDDRGRCKGKKIGCTEGSNVLVTNEEEITQSLFLQKLITDGTLIPLFPPEEIQEPVVKKEKNSKPIGALSNVVKEENTRKQDIKLVVGSEEDRKELEELIKSGEIDIPEVAEIKEKVVEVKKETKTAEKKTKKKTSTQQPFSYSEENPKQERTSEPDPKGANGTDLFFERKDSGIMVDDYQKEYQKENIKKLYSDDVKKN